MPTIFTHPAVPLALGFGLGRRYVSARLLAAGIAASVLPDIDVLAFAVGIPYDHALGHRGMTHSLAFAALVALAGAAARRLLQTTFMKAFFFLFAAAASHGILDAFTSGGLGVALLWPFSTERYFARFQLIQVAPISISKFLSYSGPVLLSEFIWVWLPCLAGALLLRLYSRWFLPG